jgi:hypothetical protein
LIFGGNVIKTVEVNVAVARLVTVGARVGGGVKVGVSVAVGKLVAVGQEVGVEVGEFVAVGRLKAGAEGDGVGVSVLMRVGIEVGSRGKVGWGRKRGVSVEISSNRRRLTTVGTLVTTRGAPG